MQKCAFSSSELFGRLPASVILRYGRGKHKVCGDERHVAGGSLWTVSAQERCQVGRILPILMSEHRLHSFYTQVLAFVLQLVVAGSARPRSLTSQSLRRERLK